MMQRITAITALVLLTSCSDETGLWIRIDAPTLAEGRDYDILEVEIVASRDSDTGPGAQTCQTVRRTIPEVLGSPPNLPAYVVIEGNGNWRCVGVRVSALQQGTARVVTEELFCPDFDFATEEEINLDVACLDHTDCEDDEICRPNGVQATCQLSPVGALFDVQPLPGEICDRDGL